MKLIFHAPEHKKNLDSIKLMCASKGIDCEITDDDERVKHSDYDILVLNKRYIDPSLIPSHIKIIYGPQHWVFPEGPLVGPRDPSLDGRCVYNCLCEWNKRVFETEFPQLKIALEAFPFGIDVVTCAPPPELPTKLYDCVLYLKERDPQLHAAVENTLKKRGVNYKAFKYGSYVDSEYVTALGAARFMIVVGRHESQGFALQEAMARNIPLLVVDAKSMKDEYNNHTHSFIYETNAPDKKLLATSVPYWSDSCGIRIESVDQFPDALDAMFVVADQCEPRQFILDNLTPALCMEKILTYFDLQAPKN